MNCVSTIYLDFLPDTKTLLHDVFYTTLGSIQWWSLTDIAFIKCYMMGRLSYYPLFLLSTADTLLLII